MEKSLSRRVGLRRLILMQSALTVRTLGVFSVSVGEKAVSDNSVRSQKLWKVFKYLLTNRHKMTSVESLIDVLWPDEEPDNPQKSLQTLLSLPLSCLPKIHLKG